MKKTLSVIATFCSLYCVSQTYTLEDVALSLKTFNTHMVYLEGPRTIVGSYDSVELNKTYYKILHKGELWAAGQQFGSLRREISFDARDISQNITVEPYADQSGAVNRWDVVLRTKGDLTLIHFVDEQITTGTHFIRLHQDVSAVHLIFVSEQAANRFRTVATRAFNRLKRK